MTFPLQRTRCFFACRLNFKIILSSNCCLILFKPKPSLIHFFILQLFLVLKLIFWIEQHCRVTVSLNRNKQCRNIWVEISRFSPNAMQAAAKHRLQLQKAIKNVFHFVSYGEMANVIIELFSSVLFMYHWKKFFTSIPGIGDLFLSTFILKTHKSN